MYSEYHFSVGMLSPFLSGHYAVSWDIFLCIYSNEGENKKGNEKRPQSLKYP